MARCIGCCDWPVHCERHPTFFENNMKPESFANQLIFCACVFIFQTSAYSTNIISVFSAIFTLLLYTSTQSNLVQCKVYKRKRQVLGRGCWSDEGVTQFPPRRNWLICLVKFLQYFLRIEIKFEFRNRRSVASALQSGGRYSFSI